jgi:uncharacterized RmlC-like cupin family protein
LRLSQPLPGAEQLGPGLLDLLPAGLTFVDATPISGPASSINARSDSRTSELVATLHNVNVAA